MSTTALPTLTPATTESATAQVSPDIPTAPIWRLSVDDYHAMIDASILKSGDPVELLEGWLVTKMTKYPPHVLANRKTRRALDRQLPDGWFAESQDPITTTDSEPEPDVSVIRGAFDDYSDRHPTPSDVALVVEISDSSLNIDRTAKKRIYAAASIPLYWIVNLVAGQVEVFHDPSGPSDSPTYANEQIYKPGDEIPLAIDGRDVATIAVNELLP